MRAVLQLVMLCVVQASGNKQEDGQSEVKSRSKGASHTVVTSTPAASKQRSGAAGKRKASESNPGKVQSHAKAPTATSKSNGKSTAQKSTVAKRRKLDK